MPPKRRDPEPGSNGFVYDYLGSEDKQQIIRNKRANIQAQHWDAQLNRLVVEAMPESPERDEHLAKFDLAIASAEHSDAILKALDDSQA